MVLHYKIVRIRLFWLLIVSLLLWLTCYCIFYLTQVGTVGTLKANGYKDLGNRLDVSELTPVIDITVFYECLCPDSKSFIIDQLHPAVMKIPAHLNTVMVPYGKAQTTIDGSKIDFQCQHGPLECYGNKIHSCVIAHVEDSVVELQVISCMIADNLNPERIGSDCCKKYGVDWAPILQCAKGPEGSELLKKHGDTTHALSPKVSFIPTILLNGSRNHQQAVLKNLWKQLCEIFSSKQVLVPECITL